MHRSRTARRARCAREHVRSSLPVERGFELEPSQSGWIDLHPSQFVATWVEEVEAPTAGETEDRFGDGGAGSGDGSKGRLLLELPVAAVRTETPRKLAAVDRDHRNSHSDFDMRRRLSSAT
jgi:hypothetical protein